MKRLIVLLLCCYLALPGAALAQSGTPLEIPAGQHVDDSVATVAQDIRVDGVVDGDVTSWSGTITVAGTVGGDVVSYGGPVVILPSAQVRGHVLASGGQLQVTPGAVVAGQAIRGAEGSATLASLLDLFIPGTGGGGGALGNLLLGAAAGVLIAAFCMLFSVFWPRRTLVASLTLRRLPARAVALGVLTTIVIGMVLPLLAAVLVASVIGVPVLLLAGAGAVALYIYGLAVLARWASAQLAAGRDQATDLSIATVAVVVGLVLVVAIAVAVQPLYGLAALALLASPGIGAAILSRGGMALPLAAA
jgi:hypothetical protein